MRFLLLFTPALFVLACNAQAATDKAPEAKPSEPSVLEAVAQGDKFTVTATVQPAQLKAGATGTYALTVSPKDGFVVKKETPFKGKLSSATGIKITKDSFSNKDFADDKATSKSVQTTFVANAAGQHAISADLTFFVCNDEMCERFKAKPELSFAVK